MNLALILGSLIAVLAVIAIVRWAGLGEAVLADADEAREYAEAMLSGFVAGDVALSEDGESAIIAGADHSYAVLKRQGSQFAARRLRPPLATGAVDDRHLVVRTDDRFFGVVEIEFADSDARDRWQARLEGAT